MLRHAISQDDREVCGLLVGSFETSEASETITIDQFIPVDNIATDCRGLFVMDPSTQIRVFKDAHIKGKAIVGCFHSHPFNFGIPSRIDEANINEDYAWLIWGGQDNEIRAWYPRDYKDPSRGFQASHLVYVNK